VNDENTNEVNGEVVDGKSDGITDNSKATQQHIIPTKIDLPHLSKPIIRSLSGTQFKYSPVYNNNGMASSSSSSSSTSPSSAPGTTRESSRNRSQQAPLPLSARSPHPLSKSTTSPTSASTPSLTSSSMGSMQRMWSSQHVNSKNVGSSQQLPQLSQTLDVNRIRNSTLVMFHPPKNQGRPNTMQPHAQSSPSIPHRNGLSTAIKSTGSLPSVSAKKHSSTPNKSYASSPASKVSFFIYNHDQLQFNRLFLANS